MRQERMFCRECKREWLQPRANYTNSSPCSITGNPIFGPNCPVCGSPELHLIYYNAEPGLDIPRDEFGNPTQTGYTPPKPIEVIPGLIGTNSLNIHMKPSPLLLESEAALEAEEVEPPSGYYRVEYGE